MRNGHRGRPWGLYAAVVISVLAIVVLISQLAMAAHRHPAAPEPAGTVQPLPLWSPSGQESHGDGSGARIYLSIPAPSD